VNPGDKLKNVFKEEAGELLDQLEGYLLDLEKDPDNQENINAVFRVMHTIKGSAGMVGYQNTNLFTHKIEDAFDMVRKGKIPFNKEIADLSLEVRDLITQLLAVEDDPDDELKALLSDCLKKVDVMVKPGMPEVVPITDKTEPLTVPVRESAKPERYENNFCLKFRPPEDVFLRGIRPLSHFDELQVLGIVTVVSHLDNIPPLKDIREELCYTSWEIFVSTDEDRSSIEKVFKFVSSPDELKIQQIQDVRFADGETKKLGQILEEKGLITKEELETALKSQKRIGEVLVEENRVSRSDLEAALKEQEHLKKISDRKAASTSGSIRVGTERLDKFVNLVGELVTLSARLDQVARKTGDMELESVAENLQRLMEDLRDSALGIRMVPIGEAFNSFRRLVRDLSLELGKQIRLETEGGDTELDKTVIDRLQDPLMHLIRNSLDHGIESPARRSAAGKNPEGTITLSAKHAGGNFVLTIHDDGAGLNKERIHKKAVEKGLVSKDANLSDEDIYKMIFMSGFSTAEIVSRVSGRGVGMDVVKREIDSLGGHISVTSREGEFTKLSFTLPLTMAIIDGLLVRVEEDFYIIPLASVESCLDMEEVMKSGADKEGDIIQYRGHFMPFFRLRPFLNYSTEPPEQEQVVVIRTEDSLYGIVVDQVMGDHQTVIKNLGKTFKDARSFSGASILGSGQVALILNVTILGRLWQESTGSGK
jgi:two-component system chemotaxis sensor kinase CheA